MERERESSSPAASGPAKQAAKAVRLSHYARQTLSGKPSGIEGCNGLHKLKQASRLLLWNSVTNAPSFSQEALLLQHQLLWFLVTGWEASGDVGRIGGQVRTETAVSMAFTDEGTCPPFWMAASATAPFGLLTIPCG